MSNPAASLAYTIGVPSVPEAPESGDLAGRDDWADRLDTLRVLRDGWDGSRAPGPSEAAVARAMLVMQRIAPTIENNCRVEIAPFIDGGVAISLEHPSGRWVDLTIRNDRSLEVERSDVAEDASPPSSDLDRDLHWLLGK